MRWKAFHFLRPEEAERKETYGFKSQRSPPHIENIKHFEDDMLRMIQNIKFKDTKFQSKLRNIKNQVKKPGVLLIPADKTTNYYAMNADNCNKLIADNVTKTYKKSTDTAINSKAASIAKNLEIDDRVEKIAHKEAFITLKDKTTFNDHLTCRLINPSKSEIGKISKYILDEINQAIT